MMETGGFRLFAPLSDATRRTVAGALLLSAAGHAGTILWAVSGPPVREMAVSAGGTVAIEVVLIEGPENTAAGEQAKTAGRTQAGPYSRAMAEPDAEPEHPGRPPGTDPGAGAPTEADVKISADSETPPAPPAVDGAPIPPPKPRERASARSEAAESETARPETAPSPTAIQVSLHPVVTEPTQAVAVNPAIPGGGSRDSALPGGIPGETTGAAPRADNPAPSYPDAARRRGQEGRVVLRVEVLPDGAAGAVRIERSSGVGSLDKAAFETVQHWRFRPAQKDGRPITATVQVPVRFALK